MFRIDVLQDQWIVGALLAGIALILTVVLAYMAFWQPRTPEDDKKESAPRTRRVPWILIVTYVGVIVLIVAFTLAKAFHPPNW